MKKSTYTISDTAWLDFYQQENPRDDATFAMPAVIICPGGSYQKISKRESEPLAFAFLAQGYQVFVLDYTVMDKGTTENFLADNLDAVHQAFELIHEHELSWQVDTDKIFLLGCSAGGHLAAWYSNHYKTYRPRGVILCYPVTSFTFGWPDGMTHFNFPLDDAAEYNTAEMVSPTTPPTFVWHTAEDQTVPVYNSLKYCERLGRYQVPFEAHFFEEGPHGLSLANRVTAPNDDYIIPPVQRWLRWAVQWMERQLKNGQR